MTLSGRDSVCVGFSDWGKELQTNEQHLLRRLAAENRILFVESLGLRRPQVAGRDIRRIGRRLVHGLQAPRAVDGIHVLSPLVLPLHSNAEVRRLNAELLPRLVRRAVRRLGMRDVLLWSFVPQAEVLIDALRPAQVLYYCDDDHGAKPGIDEASFIAAERRFTPRADAVLASAPDLVEKLRARNPNVEFAPNVADTRLFATALEDGPVDPAVAALPHPRIVFVGSVNANAVDIPLTTAVCALRPDWSFVFVGPRAPGDPGTDISALQRTPNLHLAGSRPYADLPGVLRGGDVALLPYLTEGAMRSVFPMKTFEYLASGLPVVTTRLPALAGLDEVNPVTTPEEMVAAIEHELAADTPARRAARSAAAQAHSWEERIAQIARVLEPDADPTTA